MTRRSPSVLDALNPQQREAAQCIDGPVLIFAGAGSGKTRALTYRIAHMVRERGIAPETILAVTFTNKAANEMKERIVTLIGEQAKRVWAGTFHSICARMLRADGQVIGIPANFVIFDSAEQVALVKEALSVLDVDPKQFTPADVHTRISRAKNELITVADFGRTRKGSFEEVAVRAYRVYQEKLAQNNALDFDDLLMRAVELLTTQPEVLARYQQRLQHLLVDEYQDINFAQYRFINTLASSHGNICVVGDDDQSIYGWRGANVGIILAFESDYPHARVVKLEQNYRSTKKILDCAFEVIRHNKERADKRLHTENEEGENIVVYKAVNETQEAEWVAETIQGKVKGGEARQGDYAILYRTNAMSRNFEEQLIQRSIPYRVVGGLRFYERSEIKDIVAYLRVLFSPADGVSFRRIINKPTRGLGDKTVAVLDRLAYENGVTLYKALRLAEQSEELAPRAKVAVASLADLMGRLREVAARGSITDLARAVIEQSGYVEALKASASAEAAGRVENIEEFVTLTQKFEESYEGEDPQLAAFLQHIALLTDIDEAEDPGNAVSLLTLHSAKGLEFPVVFMVGLEESILPHQRSMSDERELAEERRLCYVGITRAQRRLYLTYASRRTIYGQPQDQRPSRFLRDLPEKLVTREDDVTRLARPTIFEDELEDLEASARPGGRKLDLTQILSRGKRGPLKDAPRRTTIKQKRGPSKPGGSETDGFRTGTKVRHPKFGDGIVVSVEGGGEDAVLTVAFVTAGVKKLAAAYAKLTKR